MHFQEHLVKNKKLLVDQWFDQVLMTYPQDTARFIKSQSDPFANPVGSTTRDGLGVLVDYICGRAEEKDAAEALDPIVRIRAVQNFTPARAVGFVYQFKKIIRTLFRDQNDPARVDHLLTMENKIDDLALTAFNIFVSCREKIFQLKANTQTEKMYQAFQRAGIITKPDDITNDINTTKRGGAS